MATRWFVLLLMSFHSGFHAWDVHSIQGCAYDYQIASPAFGLTLGCHRMGGQTITLKGTFEQEDASLIAIKLYQKAAPTITLDCSSIVRQSLNVLTCVTPAATGFFWLPRVISLDTAVVASLPSNATQPDVSLSYIAGGLEVLKEGLSLYVDFMTPGDSTATFRSGGYMQGLTVNTVSGTLDANIWRVQGLNGASSDSCYAANPPSSINFDVGQCGTFWGFGMDVPRSNTSGTYPLYSDTESVFSNNFISSRSSFASPSSFTGWNLYGGLTSTQVGGNTGGLMFVPYARSSGDNDLVPGSLDMRLTNLVGQTITGLSVRYSLQCRNMFNASTTIKLQYAHFGSEDWYYYSVANTAYSTPLNATVSFVCAANDASCWDQSTFIDAEITGLQWVAEKDFFLRWNVASTASTDEHGDPCRITDIELTPFVVSSGDYSLKFDAVQLPYVDISAGSIAEGTNYTIEMNIHPSSMSFPPTSGLARTDVTSNMTLVSTWNIDTPNSPYEWSWMLLPSGSIAVVQQLPANSSGTFWISKAVVPFDRWTYLVLQQLVNSTGLFLQVYIGGYLADEHRVSASVPGLGGTTVNSRIRLGQSANAVGPNPFIGLMDEVRIWEVTLSSGVIYANQGQSETNAYNQRLKLYLKMDDSSNGTMHNSRLGVSSSTWIITTPWTTAPLSAISSSSTLSLTGGSIQCSKAYIVPGANTTCTFGVLTQNGEARTMLTTTYFSVQLVSGVDLGTLTALKPDSTGSMWSFTFIAGAKTGTATVQAYDVASDPLAGPAASIVIVPAGCQGCEYRSTVNGYKVYSCLVDERRFLRRDITNVAGTCPVS
eukprot:GGOE01020795.1.p1 GENE.GGOE01020795.1~~GGOE01020795.1.p1  ORF type:complete len:834 (-),score=134.52 GGOE01020795.1:282-2756(-)